MMTHFSLFSGIGGLDLAGEWAGFQTVGQCEWADYPTKVLEKHWPDVPRWRDIREVTADSFRERTGLRTVTVISGGFPCQPFSVAGKQKGKGDDRYLWPEMLRVIRELTPRWVIGENVPGILSIAADDVCKNLEREGYEVGIFDYEAAAVGAKHRRERIFFVGHSKRQRWARTDRIQESAMFTKPSEDVSDSDNQGLQRRISRSLQKCSCERIIGESCSPMADAESERCGEKGIDRKRCAERTACSSIIPDSTRQLWEWNWRIWNRQPKFANSCWWDIEPNVGRVANGIPSRVDRLKCLGNAVVPQQAYPIFQAIADIEVQYGKQT
jgi:DNA (cytosine-5)-methyltransferase 1